MEPCIKMSKILLRDIFISQHVKMGASGSLEYDKRSISEIARITNTDRRTVSQSQKNKDAMEKAKDYSEGYLQIPKWLLRLGLKPELVIFISFFLECIRNKLPAIFFREDTLADILGVTVRTLRRYKAQLKKLGILNWEKKMIFRTNNKACFYTLNENMLVQKCPAPLRKNVLNTEQIFPKKDANMSSDKDLEKDSLKRLKEKATQVSCVSISEPTETDTERLHSLPTKSATPPSHDQKNIQYYKSLFRKIHKEGGMVTNEDSIGFWRALLTESRYKSLAQVKFTSKEEGMLGNLIKELGLKAWQLLEYGLLNWEQLKKEITWAGSRNSLLQKFPSFERIYSARRDVLMVMDKENKLGIEKKGEKEEMIIVTKPEDIPDNYPDRKSWLKKLNKWGSFQLPVLKEKDNEKA